MGILSQGLKGCLIIARLAGGEKKRLFWRLLNFSKNALDCR
jgi:hypothetical protein